MIKRLRAAFLTAVLAAVSLTVYSAASYPSAIKSFTTKASGDTVQAAHVNDLQDEVVALETDLLKAPTDVGFSAGNFTASSGNWTLAAGDQTTLSYHKIGMKMVVIFTLDTTTVSATPTTLQIAIPGGFIASKDAYIGCFISDNGTKTTGRCFVNAAGTVIKIQRTDTAALATSVDNTTVYGEITFFTTT